MSWGKVTIATGGKQPSLISGWPNCADSAAKTIAVHASNSQAFRGGEPAKHSVKGREHFLDALGSMIGNFRPGRESFGTRTLENHKVAVRKNLFQRRIKRLHHRNVENIERRAIERNPRRAIFEPQLNGFVAAVHDRSGA